MAVPTGEEIAQRLAKKSGLAKEQAKAFVDALLALIAEERASSSFLGLLVSAIAEDFSFQHIMTIPLITHEDGTLKVNSAETGRLFPPAPRPVVPKITKGSRPHEGVRPPIFLSDVGSGGYTGPKFASPYAKLVIHPGHDAFDLSKLDLTDLPEAVNKVLSASRPRAIRVKISRIGKLKKEL